MKKILLVIVAVMSWATMLAVPAKPVPFTHVQSDGSTVTLVMRGGEDDYLATLDGNRFVELMNGRKYASVKTGLPKFSFDWSDSLVDVLKGMGLTDCFDDAYSDLTGLGTYDLPASFVVSDVIHKTHIEVDESGTRAAAVTAVVVDTKGSVQENPYEVILDRPFVYAIVDTTNMLPVFIGTVANPA